MRKYVLMLIFPFMPGEIYAQSCSQNLRDATGDYYNGRFREVSQKLDGCITELSKEEKSDGLKLLVDTYLVLGETETADRYMYDLLLIDPDFEPRESDLVEFRNLYDSYRVITKYSFGIVAGPMQPDYRIIKHQSHSGEAVEPDDYKESIGYFLGLTGEALLVKNIYLSAGIFYDKRGFEQEESILGFQSVKSLEREHRLNIPLQLKYVYPLRQIRPFISGGYSYHYIFKATGDLEHFGIEPEFPGVNIGLPYSQDNYDLIHLRKRSTLNWIVSAGAQAQIRGGFLLELKFAYERGFNNLIERENRYSDPILIENFAYVPDDFKVSSWMISIAILRNYSKPKKK